ncbi:MAG TPA: alpha/beta hydrolase [Actinomycetota bacterium]|nr:alpha/beta hydrolase [Actinomycetota bacterium]
MEVAGRDARFELRDGRVLEYWDGGDPDGRVMILHPGTPETRVTGRWGHDAACSAGVRLVAVNRPGYGGSTTAAGQPSLRATGRDTAALAAGLGVKGYAVCGLSGGGPFAVATALADPEHVRALGVVAGVGPWRLLDDPSSLPEERACLALLDAGDVTGARDCMLGNAERDFQPLRALDDDGRVDAFMAQVGDHSSLIQDPGYRAIWAENMRLVLDRMDGYVFDNLAWGGAWDVDPSDVAAATVLFYGDADTHCPPETHGRWYADRITDSELVVFPGAVHLDAVDAHWPEVLAGLLRVWA